MIAVSQAGSQYHYLHWIPSESGPMITQFGNIKGKNENLLDYKQHQHEIFLEILSNINVDEPIFSFSLDKRNLIISSSYMDANNPNLFNWYKMQVHDPILDDAMDYYHYSIQDDYQKKISIAIPKIIRKSIKENLQLLEGRLNSLSTGIFSAENGARVWFHASSLDSYVIWKIGNKKQDEILYVDNDHLSNYFSINRTKNKVKLNWQFGKDHNVNKICKYIESLINDDEPLSSPVKKIYLYTCEGKIQDVKYFMKKDEKNMVLLNPFSVLKIMEIDKVNLYDTLPFAEIGNAFGKIDV